MALSASELGLNVSITDEASKNSEKISQGLNRTIEQADKLNERLKLMQQSLQGVKEAMNVLRTFPVPTKKEMFSMESADLQKAQNQINELKESYKSLSRLKREATTAISGTKIQIADVNEKIKGYQQLQQ